MMSELSVNLSIGGLYITSGNTTAPVSVTVFVSPLLTSVVGVTALSSTVEGPVVLLGHEAHYGSSP